jgi:hypothetical protein
MVLPRIMEAYLTARSPRKLAMPDETRLREQARLEFEIQFARNGGSPGLDTPPRPTSPSSLSLARAT